MAARTCLLLLFLVSAAILAFGDDVIIDCGTSDVYIDDNLVVWMGDESFMGNIGQSQVVQTRIGMSQAMTTLRVFTSGKKNCYTIKSSIGQRVLARASFYYGNYDKKSAPPTFDLLFDGNSWATIQTSLDQVFVTEVSYVVKRAVTNICLVQSKANQFPFISALEVRELGTKMYSLLDSSYALVTKERVAYGATRPIRFSDDGYDRVWSPAGVGSSGLLIVKNDETPALIDVSAIPEKPPQAVFAAAVTTPSTAYSLTLSSSFPAGEFHVYVNLYFTEVTQLTSTETRSFYIYLNTKLLYATPVVPSYGSAMAFSFSATASSKSTIVLEPALSSTLPPLISAAEVFYVIGPLIEGTDSNDVGSPGSGDSGGGGSGGGSGGGGGGGFGGGGGGGGGRKRKSKTPVVLGTTIPAFFVLSGIAAALYVKRRRGAIGGGGGGGGAGGGVNGPNDVPQAEPREDPVVVAAMVNISGNVNPANAIG